MQAIPWHAQRLIRQRRALRRILEEEDDLIAAHRWQIEETMAIVRQEMALLGQVFSYPDIPLPTHPVWPLPVGCQQMRS